MTLEAVALALKDLNIDVDTISFYTALDEHGEVVDATDSDFGHCDVTWEQGFVGTCVARSLNGEKLIEFTCLDSLIGGHVGRLAGAF